MEAEKDLYHLLAGPNKIKTAFELPEGHEYFNNLPAQVLQQVINGEKKEHMWRQISKKVPYEAPTESYFNVLPGIIVKTLQEIPVLPATIKQPEGIPDNYFENLPYRVLEKTRSNPKPGKIVNFRIFKRIAVAAAILVTALTGWMVYNNYSPARSEGYNLVKKEMKNISGSYIDTYVTETGPEEISSAETAPLTGHNDFKKLMQSVPDNVIDNFLDAVDKNSTGDQEEIL